MSSRTAGFTLLELLIVLIIIGIFFAISYPIIANQLNGIESGGAVAQTSYTIKYFLANRNGNFKNRKIYIEFNFSKNDMTVYFKKRFELKRLRDYKYSAINYGAITLDKIKSAGNTYETGKFYMEISSSYVSPPLKLYFTVKGKEKTVSVNTYYD